MECSGSPIPGGNPVLRSVLVAVAAPARVPHQTHDQGDQRDGRPEEVRSGEHPQAGQEQRRRHHETGVPAQVPACRETRLRRLGQGAPATVGEIGRERPELIAKLCCVRGGETLLAFLQGQPALGHRRAQDLGVLLALLVGGPHPGGAVGVLVHVLLLVGRRDSRVGFRRLAGVGSGAHLGCGLNPFSVRRGGALYAPGRTTVLRCGRPPGCRRFAAWRRNAPGGRRGARIAAAGGSSAGTAWVWAPRSSRASSRWPGPTTPSPRAGSTGRCPRGSTRCCWSGRPRCCSAGVSRWAPSSSPRPPRSGWPPSWPRGGPSR